MAEHERKGGENESSCRLSGGEARGRRKQEDAGNGREDEEEDEGDGDQDGGPLRRRGGPRRLTTVQRSPIFSVASSSQLQLTQSLSSLPATNYRCCFPRVRHLRMYVHHLRQTYTQNISFQNLHSALMFVSCNRSRTGEDGAWVDINPDEGSHIYMSSHFSKGEYQYFR